jgi:SAM-dependent methyltransferase
MGLDHTKIQLAEEISRTSEDIRRRYRENRNWRIYPKEWVFKNVALKGKDVLDFGCGTGEIATQIAFLGANRIYALDVTPGLLDLTRRRAELDGVADRIETVFGMVQDIEPRPVDVIVVNKVLHHCCPLENVMPALLRWLKLGGVFVAIEPANYLASLRWLRDHSGISTDPLDDGERQLGEVDLQYIRSYFPQSQTIHFHLLNRLCRIWPKGVPLYCRMDRLILRVPKAWKLAGTAIILAQSQ